MNVLLVNGSLDNRADSTVNQIIHFLAEDLNRFPVTTTLFQLADAGIPLFDPNGFQPTPDSVQRMADVFRGADAHIWLSPLYHGSLTGAFKNCLDWLEVSRSWPLPYLTDKRIGLVCVADGLQAMQGIQAMDAVAKALRAWTLPFSVPVARAELYQDGQIAPPYADRFRRLNQLLCTTQPTGPVSLPEAATRLVH